VGGSVKFTPGTEEFPPLGIQFKGIPSVSIHVPSASVGEKKAHPRPIKKTIPRPIKDSHL